MKNDKIIMPLERITFMLSNKEKVNLKMICLKSNISMSDFIRFAIQEKIKNSDIEE